MKINQDFVFLHDEVYLRKIELWMRRLSWYYLAFFILYIPLMIYIVIKTLNDPGSWGFIGEFVDHPILIIQLSNSFGFLKVLLHCLFVYTVAVGTSKLIRYLLALKAGLLQRKGKKA